MLRSKVLRRKVRLRESSACGTAREDSVMLTRWFSFGRSTCSEVCRSAGTVTTFRPSLEQLEEREVPSANPLDALLGSVPGLVPIQFNSLTNPQVNSSGQLQFTGQGQIGG